MGARNVAVRRPGPPTQADKELIETALVATPHELTTGQLNGLAAAIGKKRSVVVKLVEEAREKLAERAEFYLDAHKQVVTDALSSAAANADGETAMAGAKYLEVAQKASQWGLENISIDGVRIVDGKAAAGSGGGGTKIMIGVNMGSRTAPAVTTEVVEGETVGD